MLGKFKESVIAYRKSIQLNHAQPECHFNLGSAYKDLEQYKQAK